MGVLDRIFGRKAKQVEVAPAAPCMHTALAPRWAEASHMGDESKASEWTCTSCGTRLTPEQAREVRANEAELLREKLAVPEQPSQEQPSQE
jgi:hypothetical protein